MTPTQQPLFLETVYEALKSAVAALGGPKIVGARLWPQKSVDDARRLLLDCLNPDRAEKLDPEQVVLLLLWAREAGYHAAKHWVDEATGYQASPPQDPAIERDRLATVIENATKELTRALEQAQKLTTDTKPTLRPVA